MSDLDIFARSVDLLRSREVELGAAATVSHAADLALIASQDAVTRSALASMEEHQNLMAEWSRPVLETARVASLGLSCMAKASEMPVIYRELETMMTRESALAELCRPIAETARIADFGLAGVTLASEMPVIRTEVATMMAQHEVIADLCRPMIETARIANLGLVGVPLASEMAVFQRDLSALMTPHNALVEACRPMIETASIAMKALEATGLSHLTTATEALEFWKPFQAADWFTPHRHFETIFDDEMVAADAVYEAGWMPHYTTPFALVKEWLEEEKPDLSARLDAYYRENWAEVAAAIRARLAESGADPETVAGMNEALAAHGHGLYRAACRTVFPEMERAARIGFYVRLAPKHSIVSLREFRDRLETMDAADLFNIGRWAFRAYCALSDNAYAKFEGGSRAANDTGTIPNRHAVAHGLSGAQGHQQSVNALLLADFCLAALDLVIEQDRAA